MLTAALIIGILGILAFVVFVVAVIVTNESDEWPNV